MGTSIVELRNNKKGVVLLEVEFISSDSVWYDCVDFLVEELDYYLSEEDIDIDEVAKITDYNSIIDWVGSIDSESLRYITRAASNFEDTYVSERPEEGKLTGYWDIYEGDLSDDERDFVDNSVKKSETLADLLTKLGDRFDYVGLVYDERYDNASYYVRKAGKRLARLLPYYFD